MGISNINERASTWDADYYLYEQWTPAAGFAPQTEIVNEVERHNTQYEQLALRDGVCVRSRRLHSNLRSSYNLRMFPFDHQHFAIEVSDDEFPSAELKYDAAPYAVGLDDDVRSVLSAWKIEREPTYSRASKAFKWEHGAPSYDYATVGFDVRRHVTFHLVKYFLPLFVLLALSFSVFWIDAEDLGAPLTIGITCLLAAIAFQLAEAGTLPEVSYLTLADRVYVVCYIAIGLAVVETIYANSLFRRGEKVRASNVDRRSRIIFPLAVTVALVVSVVRAFLA